MDSLEKEPKTKSMPFPSESLEESIDFVNKIVEQRGESIVKGREISLSTGIPEGSLPLIVSSACQYGLLENVHGSGYRPTDLYRQITSPTFESDRQQAMFAGLSTPALYKVILDEFNGKVLPNEKGFANHLVKYRFKPYAVPKITRAFFVNFRPYIDNNNRLRFIQPVKKELGAEPFITEAVTYSDSPREQKMLIPPQINGDSFKQPIPLPNGKMIVLEYPKGSMTEEDFDALTAFISYLRISEGIKKRE